MAWPALGARRRKRWYTEVPNAILTKNADRLGTRQRGTRAAFRVHTYLYVYHIDSQLLCYHLRAA